MVDVKPFPGDQIQEPKSWNIDNWNNEVYKFERDALIKNKLGLIVNKRYEIVQRIDAGAFGSTYIGEDLQNNRQRVAVKFDTGGPEYKRSKRDENHLKYEFEYEDGYDKIYGFASVHWFGYQFGHNILAMELLGASVASLFSFCDRKFGWQTILYLGQQMLTRIKHLHLRGFIHRDIKPENYLMGLGKEETTCYLIDFGLARRYRYRHPDDRTLKHIPFRKGRSFIGTAKYASINSHRNLELARRDDLESLGYVLIELINGHLPWRNICRRNQANKHQTYMRIRQSKEQANWKEICPAMSDYMNYCRELQFAEEPDYDKVLRMLRANVSGQCRSEPGIDTPKCETCQSLAVNNLNPSDLNPLEHMTASMPACSWSGVVKASEDAEGLDRITEDLVDLSLTSKQSCCFKPSSSRSGLSHDFVIINSSDMIKSNLSAHAELRSSVSPASSQKTREEEDSESVTSCQNCRQRQQQYFDQACLGGQRLSWQIWRDLTPDNRFQYDNRFSWTLPAMPQPNQFTPSPNQFTPSLRQPPIFYAAAPPATYVDPRLLHPQLGQLPPGPFPTMPYFHAPPPPRGVPMNFQPNMVFCGPGLQMTNGFYQPHPHNPIHPVLNMNNHGFMFAPAHSSPFVPT